MPLAIIPSFARGELSPGLHGRVDTAVYHVGLKAARNAIIHAAGGISNRPGLKFIGPVKDHTRFTRLITFKFKGTDTYTVEMGNLYLRFIRNDAHVLETAKNITGATQANPCVITVGSHGYSNGQEVYIESVGGMTQLNARRFKVANVTANTFELTDQATGANINSTSYGAYTSGGTAARVYEIATPYAEADLETIKFTQSADVMTLTHPSYEPRELTRTGHASWTLATITFSPKQSGPTALTAAQQGTTGSTTYKWKITAISSDTLEESLPGLSNSALASCTATATNPVRVSKTSHGLDTSDEVEASGFAQMTQLNGRRFTVDRIDADTFDLRAEDGTSYAAETTGGTMTPTHAKVTNGNATLNATNHVTFAGTAATGASKYAVYRQKDGLYGMIGETNTIAQFIDDGKTPDFDIAPPGYKEPFRGTNNAPGATSYYEQRQVYGGSNNKPDTSFYSQTGNFKNMTVSEPANPDDAITATLNSLEVDAIRHYIPMNDLVTLTSGGEWRINASEESGFSAATLRQKPQSRWGAGHQRPVIIGATTLYVPETNAGLRSIGYSLEIDGYTGPDLGITAAHLFLLKRVRDAGLTYAKMLDPLACLVREDGRSMVMTFQQEQEVIGWARWDTYLGEFESVTSTRPSATEPDEALFYVVKRRVNGNTVRYIERTSSRRFEEVQDCFFVDCGASVDSPVTITGVSLANPCVVTAPSHGFANDDEVDISSIEWVPTFDSHFNETQPDQLNGRRYKVKNKTANTFELQDPDTGSLVDSSSYKAYYRGGKVRKTFSTVTAWHLNGETVVALSDGNVVANLTVTNGVITLPRNASRFHYGFRIVSDVELLNIEPRGNQNDTLQGVRKRVVRVTVLLERTRGLLFGPDKDNLVEWKQRDQEKMGEPTRLQTGELEVIVKPQWNSNGRLLFRQFDPLPFTLLAAVPKLEGED